MTIHRKTFMVLIALKTSVMVIIFILASHLPISSAGFETQSALLQGTTFHKQKNYAKAFEIFSNLAKLGDAQAMNSLGKMYADGAGIPQDYKLALHWFREAARKGEAKAESNLGELYANGWGIRQDFKQAAYWFGKAAEKGVPHAQFNLGKLCLIRRPLPCSPSKAARYFKQALNADKTNILYRNWLGSAYHEAGDYSAAAKQFSTIPAQGGKWSDVWNYSYGLALMRGGKIQEAQGAFKRALNDPPSFSREISQKKVEEKLKAAEDYLKRYAEASRYAAAGNTEEAQKQLLLALQAIETREALGKLELLEAQISRLKKLKFYSVGAVVLVLILASIFLFTFYRRDRAVTFPDPTGPIGQRLDGTYEIKEVIGHGGMGLVYEAYDHKLSRKVAVKRMRPEIRSSVEYRKRFLNEAKLIARLNHPFIVGIHAIVEWQDEIYLVFEHISGRPLSEIMRKRGPLDFGYCKNILNPVCQAVDYAHQSHIMHRDLKPSNIMLDSKGYAKVMDFGLARLAKETVSTLTHGATSGTPAYMAPEQHLGTPRRESDIYALGVCIYEMLTGALPFAGGDLLSQKERHLYPSPKVFAPDLHNGVEELIAKTLDPDPKKRFRTAGDLLEAIMQL